MQKIKRGRPPGFGKSKLDKHKEELVYLLKNGSTVSFLSRKYGTTRKNLYHWMKKNDIEGVQFQQLRLFI